MAVTLHTDLGDIKIELYCMQTPLACEYLALARRCACFSVAPASLAQALTLLSQASADLERAFYWNKGCGGGSMLLVQSTSHDSLSRALQSLYLYPRHFFSLSQHQCKRPIDNSKRFNLPPYRVCSDPSVWPASTSMALHPPKEFESLLRLQLDPLSPSALERALLQQHSLVEQMQFLVCNTVLSPPARLARFVFADSLQEILAKIRPGTTVYPFGSAINGLGSVTSDLDLSVEMGIDVAPELEALAEYHRLQVTADVSRKGNDILGDLLRFTGQTSYKLLTPIRFLLNRLDPLSAPSSRVLPGHVPIINYSRHRALGLGVDISRSVGGEHSSQVVLRAAHWMRSLVQQVPLLIFLAYALKYLARGAHVTHHGPAFGFTSYKLTTILVHFLQVTGFAPPLEYLLVQDMSPAEVVRRIFIPLKEDWTYRLTKLKRDSPKTYVLFDCPGQVELYCVNGAFRKLLFFLTLTPLPTNTTLGSKQQDLSLPEPYMETPSQSNLLGLGLRLSSVHLVDSYYCTSPGKFISVLLTSLVSMLQLGLPHVNVLSKVDLIEQYAPLKFNLDFFTEVLDLSYLVEQLDDVPFFAKYKKLNGRLAELVQDTALVNFLILDVQDRTHLEKIVRHADKGNGYVFGTDEERTLQSMLSCASGAEFSNDLVCLAQEKYTHQSSKTKNPH
nr:unnamed protein product [Spirometra erinaceieuropaei]